MYDMTWLYDMNGLRNKDVQFKCSGLSSDNGRELTSFPGREDPGTEIKHEHS